MGGILLARWGNVLPASRARKTLDNNHYQAYAGPPKTTWLSTKSFSYQGLVSRQLSSLVLALYPPLRWKRRNLKTGISLKGLDLKEWVESQCRVLGGLLGRKLGKLHHPKLQTLVINND